MGLLGFMWDVYQQNQISESRTDLSRASARANAADEDIRSLRAQVDHLSMVNMALWSIVREKLALTDQDLAARVEEIDLSDGRLDGRIGVPTRECLKCGRTVASRHDRCLYCGGQPR
jgi:hypothetical protein